MNIFGGLRPPPVPKRLGIQPRVAASPVLLKIVCVRGGVWSLIFPKRTAPKQGLKWSLLWCSSLALSMLLGRNKDPPPPPFSGPQIRQGYPPNLSISFSGGKETKEDSPSNGERTGISPAPNHPSPGGMGCGVQEYHFSLSDIPFPSPLERGPISVEGDRPVWIGDTEGWCFLGVELLVSATLNGW